MGKMPMLRRTSAVCGATPTLPMTSLSIATMPVPTRWSELLRNTSGLLLAPLLAHTLAAASVAPTPATNERPNIVLILADDLGYGDLGCYGQQKIQTPNLDRLAAEGVRFTQFYTGSPVCAPARNTMLTGEHSGHALVRGNAKLNLRATDTTLAQVLQAGGYATGLCGKWGLGEEGSDATAPRKGFDYFYGYVDQTMAHNYYPQFLVRNETRVPLRNVVPHPGRFGQGVATEKIDYSADLLADEAVRFVHEHRDRRFFLYFAPTLPHANNEAKPNGMEIPGYGAYADKDWPEPAKGYAAMVTKLDAQVGQLLEEVKRLELEDKTIVVFTSDNGPHAEGGNDPKFFNSSGGFRGMKRELYEGGIREPLIVRWPGHTRAGRTSNFVGYLPDFLPTFAEIAGVKDPPKRDGMSFVRELNGHTWTQRKHDYLYWEFYEGSFPQAIRVGKWKGVRIPMFTGEIELYDLSSDSAEQHNVAAQHPDVVEKMRRYMAKAHSDSPHWKPGRPVIGAATNDAKE